MAGYDTKIVKGSCNLQNMVCEKALDVWSILVNQW